MVKILIADDDAFIADYITRVLKTRHFEIVVARNGEEALQLFESESPDLLLLDIMMPKMDGFQVCEQVRRQNQVVPILMLTAKHQSTDKVTGLNLGADDYITKPFDRQELLARIDTALRRSKLMNGGEPVVVATSNTHLLDVDQLRMNLENWQVFFKQTELKLSKTEFNLLKAFCENRDKILDRDTLLQQVWGYQFYGNTRTVDNFVMRLRKKIQEVLEANGEKFPTLETVYGIGYRLRSSQSEEV